MRVLIVNSVCGIGSTGRICTDIADKLSKEGNEVKIAYGRDSVPEKYEKYAVRIGSSLDKRLHGVYTRLFDGHGFASKKATEKFLKWADEYDPELVWLHNLHGYYINVELLFKWIKSRPYMKVKWTLHDCWAFTGHCTHFSMLKCGKWKDGCRKCIQKSCYPKSCLIDASEKNYRRKKAAFTGVRDMTLITPSNWMSGHVKQSFLNEYSVEVCYNEIDKSVFKPTEGNFKERYCIKDKKIVLGVSSIWNTRKGFDDFLKLARLLDDRYIIVLVGLDRKQMKTLPDNVIGIERTNNTHELAEIYTAADVFVNPSKEETFGMTTVEALACGTCAVVYKDTACEEVVSMYGGFAVEQDVSMLKKKIVEVLS